MNKADWNMLNVREVNMDLNEILKTPLTDEDIWFPPSLVLLLEQNGVKTFGELLNMTYQEIDSIKGFGKTNTFKICLRAQWFSENAFYNSRLAKSLETIDERRYSRYNMIHIAVSRYKKYKKQIEENEQNINL